MVQVVHGVQLISARAGCMDRWLQRKHTNDGFKSTEIGKGSTTLVGHVREVVEVVLPNNATQALQFAPADHVTGRVARVADQDPFGAWRVECFKGRDHR